MQSPIALPIVQVTVLEDRARVERRADVVLPAGPQLLRVEGLSPLAVDHSLQVQLTGGRVAQARLHRVWKQQAPVGAMEHKTEARRRVESLEVEHKQAQADVQRLQSRLEVVNAAREDVLRAIAEQAGVGQAKPEAWHEQLATVRKGLTTTEEALRLARQRVEKTRRQWMEAHAALAQGEPSEPRLLTCAELQVEHPTGGNVSLRLSYLVPCAAWRPAYRATLAAAEGGEAVTLECEAVVWQRTGEEWADVELVFSTARPTLGASPPRLEEDWLRLRDKSDEERQTVEVSVREEILQQTGEGAAQQAEEMPGLDDGGQALGLTARHRVTLPSDGAPHRVPLFAFTSPATSELLGHPEHSPLVHRVARFENRGPSVLLAGPVELVRSSGYVGRSQLRFAGVGERVALGFGSEDTLRVIRLTDVKYDTQRLTGRRTRTHQVKLYLSHTGERPARVALEERIPVSEVEAVEVKLLEEQTRPAPTKRGEEGILRFELTAPPRSQQELTLAYALVSSSRVSGL
ncbi:MAG: mucoidy inhibitor MuiA family protein [Cystobacter sp.]